MCIRDRYKSSEDFANGIYWTLTEPDYPSLSEQACRKAISHYSENVVAKKYKMCIRDRLHPAGQRAEQRVPEPGGRQDFHFTQLGGMAARVSR